MADQPIKYSDLLLKDEAIRDLINQLDQASDAYMNFATNVKNNAQQLYTTIQKTSGATKEQRQAIKDTSEEAARLTKAIRENEAAYSENAVKIAQIKAATKEKNDVTKLEIKLQEAAVGSYNRLSAQYSLLKIGLNNGVSGSKVFVRQLNAQGTALETVARDFDEVEREAQQMYATMNELQKATGKHQLQVGNYGIATESVRTQLMKMREELVALDMAGERQSARYSELMQKAGALQDAYLDTQQAIKATASDTSKLDTVMGAATAAGGALTLYTAGMTALGASEESTAESQKKLQTGMAALMAATTLQNQLQKQSALMMGVSRIQQAALTKAKVYDRLVTMQGTKATLAATIAQRAFNIVAKANPYLLLAMAFLTVVGALVLFTSNSNKAAKAQAELNKQTAVYLQGVQLQIDQIDRVADIQIKRLEEQIAIMKAQGKPLSEIYAMEDKIASIREASHKKEAEAAKEQIANLDKNIEKLEEAENELQRLQKIQANNKVQQQRTGFDMDGNAYTYTVEVEQIPKKKLEQLIENAQATVDNLGKEVEIGATVKTKQTADDVDRANQEKERKDAGIAAAKAEAGILRETEAARRALIKSSHEQEMADLKAQYDDRIAAIQEQLKYETTLTATARASLITQQGLLRKKQMQEEVKLQAEHDKQLRDIRRKSEDATIAQMEEGQAKERAVAKAELDRQVEDLQIELDLKRAAGTLLVGEEESLTNQIVAAKVDRERQLRDLDTNATLTAIDREKERIQLLLDTVKEGTVQENALRKQMIEQQRKEELEQNKLKPVDQRQDEIDINAKYNKMILEQDRQFFSERAMLQFDQQQDLAASEFDLLFTTEREKTRFRLEQERARLQKILELNRQFGGDMTADQIKTMENQIAAIDKEMGKMGKGRGAQDLWELAGIDMSDDKKKVIEESMSFAIDMVNQFAEAKVQAAARAVEAADKEVSDAEKNLDTQLRLAELGYANDVLTAQKELENAKKTQEQALKDQEKAQKRQAQLQTLQQIGNLVTSTALIWSQLGFPWAIPAIAIMWGSFAASKIKAGQLAKKQEYGEGGYEFVDYGGSHASGNDIDFGTTRDGKARRIERGEFWGIVRKSQTAKYRNVLPAIFNSLNRGNFEDVFATGEEGSWTINATGAASDLSRLENEVSEIRKQGERQYHTDGQGRTIIRYKNRTTIVS